MGSSPLISIITVTYNSVKTLEQTINSVLDQNYNNIEYIIIDGGSKDGTMDIIHQYEKKFSTKGYSYKYISEPDNGIYDAMNKGISLSNGDLIGILNSDDWYEIDTLSTVVSQYQLNPNYDVFHGLLRNVDKDNVTTSIVGYSAQILKQHMIQHPTCFIKKEVYDSYGLFDTSFTSAADYELVLRIWTNGCKFLFIESILANFREGGISSNMNSFKEDYKVKLKYKLISYPKYALTTFYLSLKRK